jgi:hypothetical protein
MSTTIAVLALACIIVCFMGIKKVFQNNYMSVPIEEEEEKES